jgi:hypothetical protein
VLHFVLASLVCSTIVLGLNAADAARLPWDDNSTKPRTCTFMQATDLNQKLHTGEDYLVSDQALYPMDKGSIVKFNDLDPYGDDNYIIINYTSSSYASMYLHVAKGSVVAQIPELAGRQKVDIDVPVEVTRRVGYTSYGHWIIHKIKQDDPSAIVPVSFE